MQMQNRRKSRLVIHGIIQANADAEITGLSIGRSAILCIENPWPLHELCNTPGYAR
jgi:hypothetical protein